jgi:hypothetical protein
MDSNRSGQMAMAMLKGLSHLGIVALQIPLKNIILVASIVTQYTYSTCKTIPNKERDRGTMQV